MKRIVGVEMDVWTEREIREALFDGLRDVAVSDHDDRLRIVLAVIARLRGERP